MSDDPTQPRACTRIDRFGHPECVPRRIVEVLSDDDARLIYRYADDPTPVGEFIDALEIPSSTAYRKVDQLHDAGLLRRIEPQAWASVPVRYVRTIDSVAVRYDEPIRIECARNGTTVYCEV